MSNILDCINLIKEYFMEVDNVDIIYLDLSKTFDMVSCYCLLVKVKNWGISEKKKKKKIL